MGCVDKAPVGRDIYVGHQVIHRTLACLGLDVGDLFDLFGDMDVDGASAMLTRQSPDVINRRRPQRMRRDAQLRVKIAVCYVAGTAFDKAQKPVQIIAKAALTTRQWLLCDAAIGIEHWQMGQADTCGFCGGKDLGAHFIQCCIGRAAGCMVQVVKFAHSSIACL